MLFVRKLVALLCFVAVLLAAASPVASGQIWALVVPFLLWLGVLALAMACRERESVQVPTFPLLSFATPRAPPCL
jgi:hypothetical protein